MFSGSGFPNEGILLWQSVSWLLTKRFHVAEPEECRVVTSEESKEAYVFETSPVRRDLLRGKLVEQMLTGRG